MSGKIDRFKEKEATPEKMMKFRTKMCKKFGAIQLNKPTGKYMDILADFIALMTDVSAVDFIDYYSQTIYSIIFFAEKFAEFTPWRQAKIVGHECRHVVDFTKDPMAMSRYIVNAHERSTMIEANALLANYELEYWRYGKMPDFSGVKDFVIKYGCSEADGKASLARVESNMMIVEQLHESGEFLTDQAKYAVELFKELGLA